MHDGKLDIIVGAFFVEKEHDFRGAENSVHWNIDSFQKGLKQGCLNAI